MQKPNYAVLHFIRIEPFVSPDPSAGQLIAQFLYQADAAVGTATETREKEKLKNGASGEAEPEPGIVLTLNLVWLLMNKPRSSMDHLLS